MRHWELAKEEELSLRSTLNKFNNDISALLTLNSDINRSARRLVDNNSFDVLHEKIDKVRDIVSEKRTQIQELEPELESLTRSIADQERHRKIFKENISLIEARHRIEKLKKEINLVQKKKQKIHGHDTVAQELIKATAQISAPLETKARKEGSRGGFVEEICSLKVSSLSFPLGTLSIVIS
jgi:chromosome segregation ATPase